MEFRPWSNKIHHVTHVSFWGKMMPHQGKAFSITRWVDVSSPTLRSFSLMSWWCETWQVQPWRDNSFPGEVCILQSSFPNLEVIESLTCNIKLLQKYKVLHLAPSKSFSIGPLSRGSVGVFGCYGRHCQEDQIRDNLDNSKVRREARLKLTFHASNKWWSWWSMRVVRFSRKKYDSQL